MGVRLKRGWRLKRGSDGFFGTCPCILCGSIPCSPHRIQTLKTNGSANKYFAILNMAGQELCLHCEKMEVANSMTKHMENVHMKNTIVAGAQSDHWWHYNNWGVNIYYHANFFSNPTIFQFYHMLSQILPQTTTTISTNPPRFLYVR